MPKAILWKKGLGVSIAEWLIGITANLITQVSEIAIYLNSRHFYSFLFMLSFSLHLLLHVHGICLCISFCVWYTRLTEVPG